MSIRVLVVDDSVLFRRVISDTLTGLPGVEVVGSAANGRLARSVGLVTVVVVGLFASFLVLQTVLGWLGVSL